MSLNIKLNENVIINELLMLYRHVFLCIGVFSVLVCESKTKKGLSI